MKRMICFLLLFLAACMPAEYIPTIAPSPTPIPTTQPTATPDPLLSTLEALLVEGIGTTAESVGEDELLRLVVGEGEDQVVVPDTFFDEEGKFLHVGSEQIPVEDATDRLELRDDGILFLKNADGLNIAFFDSQTPESGFVFFDTPDALSKLTDEQKLALSPDMIVAQVADENGEMKEINLEKSNVSTVKPEFVIYRDKEGNAQRVHNLVTGEQMEMREAGIVELDLVDGGKWELQFFDDEEAAIGFAIDNAMWREGSWKDFMSKSRPDVTSYYEDYFKKVSGMREDYPDGGIEIIGPQKGPLAGEVFVDMVVQGYKDKTVLIMFEDRRSGGGFTTFLLDSNNPSAGQSNYPLLIGRNIWVALEKIAEPPPE